MNSTGNLKFDYFLWGKNIGISERIENSSPIFIIGKNLMKKSTALRIEYLTVFFEK